MSQLDIEISQNIYVLDSNFFIDAHRYYYDMNLFPCFWEWTRECIIDGSFILIDKVYEEITPPDELFIWTHINLDNYVQSTNQSEIVDSYREVLQCATSYQPQPNARFTQKAIDDFASVADSWLIAYAKTRGGHVVTNEQPGPARTTKIKIPTICSQLEVEFLTREQLLKQLRPVFGCRN